MNRLVFALALASMTATAHAEWTLVATGSTGTEYLMREGSQARTKTRGGEAITAVTAAIREDGRETYYRMYVRDVDCERGIGRLTVLRASGELAWHTDWASGGSSVATELARVLCNLRLVMDRDGPSAPATPAWTPAGRL
jgi:hypothetical protein